MKHPWSALYFLWGIDVVALAIIIFSFIEFPSYGTEEWVNFIIWTIILSVARLSGLIEHIGMKVGSGVSTAIEFAAVIVLPFPLLCLAIIISLVFNIFDRIYKKHPEPFIGPDFNASTILIAGFCVHLINNQMETNLLNDTLALIPSSLIYSIIQVILLTMMLSLDMKRNWKQVGTLSYDFIVTEAVFITAGLLIGRIFQLDPLLIGLTIIPIIFLHQALQKSNEAKLAYIDAKTGVYNYRHFDETYEVLFEQAVQSGQSLGLIFADMDHLRDINNNYGHQIGDLAITSVAKALQAEAGPSATVARFGGEEFVIILPKFTTAKAAFLAEKMRSHVENLDVSLENGSTIKLTISLGVASFPADALNSEDLIKAADTAVYAAKHAGRNQVKSYKEAG